MFYIHQGYLEIVKTEHPEKDLHIASLDTKREVCKSDQHDVSTAQHDVSTAPTVGLAPIVSDKMKAL